MQTDINEKKLKNNNKIIMQWLSGNVANQSLHDQYNSNTSHENLFTITTSSFKSKTEKYMVELITVLALYNNTMATLHE